MLVFSTPLVNERPSNLLTGSSTPPPSPVNKYKSTCIHTMCSRGGGDRGPETEKIPAAKYLYRSIFKKSRHLGFGVFIDIWPMVTTMARFGTMQEPLICSPM